MLNKSSLIDIVKGNLQKILILGLIGGYAIAFLLNKLSLRLLFTSLFIVLPIILSQLFLTKIQLKNEDILSLNMLQIPQIKPKLILILYVFLYLISIILLRITETRSIVYFLIICCLFSIIFLQIISKKTNVQIIFFEIMFLTINIIYGVTLKYPFYIGMSDIIGHTTLSQFIYNYGSLVPPDFEYSYSNFPLFHILIAIGALFTNLNIQITYFILGGLIILILIPFIYSIFYMVIKNQQIVLLTCLLFSSSSIVIFSGTYFVASVIAFIGFVILVYLFFKLETQIDNFNIKILLYIVALFIILVHQVSIIQILFLLTLFLIIYYLVTSKFPKTFYIYISTILIFLAYWMYSAYEFLSLIITSRTDPKYLGTVIYTWQDTAPDPNWLLDSLQYQYNNISVAIFLFFGLIGIFILIHNKKSVAVIVSFFSFICLFFYLRTPLVNLWQYEWLFGFSRMTRLVAPFMAFIMACGMYSILTENNQRYRNILVFTTILIFFLFSFSSISTTQNAGDSSELWPTMVRPYFKVVDLRAFNYIEEYSNSGEQITTDYWAFRYFAMKKYFSRTQELNIKWFETKIIPFDKIPDDRQGMIIFRKEDFQQKKTLSFGSSSLEYNDENIQLIGKKLFQNNELYSNKNVEIFMIPTY